MTASAYQFDIRNTLDQISPFVHPGQILEADVLRTPGNWIKMAIDQFESPSWDLISQATQLNADVSAVDVIAMSRNTCR